MNQNCRVLSPSKRFPRPPRILQGNCPYIPGRRPVFLFLEIVTCFAYFFFVRHRAKKCKTHRHRLRFWKSVLGRCGPGPCATSCISHFASEMQTQGNREKNAFFRIATDIETARHTFGASRRSFSGPSKFEHHTFSKKCENGKKRVFSILPCLLAHFGSPSLFGILPNLEKT